MNCPERLGKVDIVILDESESIIDQLDSHLSIEHARNFAVFQWLVETARRCIALDAFMGERSFSSLGAFAEHPAPILFITPTKMQRVILVI